MSKKDARIVKDGEEKYDGVAPYLATLQGLVLASGLWGLHGEKERKWREVSQKSQT